MAVVTTWQHAAQQHTLRRLCEPPLPPFRPARSWPTGQATAMTSLKTLVAEMAIRGLPLTSMTLTRLQAVLILPNGLAVQCCCGWLLWPTGRVSSRGRPLHTLHSIEDAAGAARRLAQHGPGHKLSAAQAAERGHA